MLYVKSKKGIIVGIIEQIGIWKKRCGQSIRNAMRHSSKRLCLTSTVRDCFYQFCETIKFILIY